MRLLHTSDWHLGHHLFDKKRVEEHDFFLEWLINTLESYKIDILLIAGDIFDNGYPPNYAMEQYYNFLKLLPQTRCKNVVIIGGNHDSPSTLNAPREILKFLNIHVVGGVEENISKEIIICNDSKDKPIGIICAVPFIRPRDINKINPGQSYYEKEDSYKNGVILHYKKIWEKSLIEKQKLNIPLIATGHLCTAGESLKQTGSEKDLYIGNQGKIPSSCFNSDFDYIALGHIHQAQKISQMEHIRYCGSPIPLSFKEASKNKSVCIADFQGNSLINVENVEIPFFRNIIFLKGNIDTIENNIKNYKNDNNYNLNSWVELQIINENNNKISDELIKYHAKEKQIEIIKSAWLTDSSKTLTIDDGPELNELKPEDVFLKLCKTKNYDNDTQQELVRSFRELLFSIEDFI